MVVPSWMWGPPVKMYVDCTAQSDGVSPEEVLEGITGRFPLRRMAEDGEVADTVAFFALRPIQGGHRTTPASQRWGDITMSKRVVVWGTGVVGKMVIAEIVRHPEFELVGVGVSNPDKVGRDAGEICGDRAASGSRPPTISTL